MFDNKNKLQPITWRSYQIIKKKAMEQELSWSGLIISLSIAFFIVIGCSLFLKVVYVSLENKNANTVKAKELNSETFIQFGSLAKVFINSASAATLESKAAPIKDTVYANVISGQSSTQTIKIKNVGKEIWKPGEVNLETGPYLKTFSKFETDAWLKFYRPVGITKEIKPGQVLEITFPLKAPTDVTGTIQENFQLVKGERPISGSLIRFFITIVSPTTSSTPVSIKTSPQVSTNQVQIKSNTVSASPLPSIPLPKTDFCISSTNNGDRSYENCNTASQENSVENGITPKLLLSVEPIIRIGLFNSFSSQRVSFNTLFDVYGGTEILFSGLLANNIVTVNFDPASRRYSVISGDIAKTTTMPLRLVPREVNGVATLLDYKNLTGWNKSLNDNAFRGVIEMRYTEPAKKVWFINELSIENYLKGLAETTNSSPLEFQKVMATAARSYALYHYLRGLDYGLTIASTKHADDYFHLDSYYDQVYRGYNSELRMSGLVFAVEATRGVAVAYADKPVITPYFSNSDGRTRDWVEVWGGTAKPWLKSVAVPQDQGKNLFGHGVGLSARGALLMVNAGTTWQDALKYFYNGTNLLKIY